MAFWMSQCACSQNESPFDPLTLQRTIRAALGALKARQPDTRTMTTAGLPQLCDEDLARQKSPNDPAEWPMPS